MSNIRDRTKKAYQFLLKYLGRDTEEPVQIQVSGPEKFVHIMADDVWLEHTVDSNGIPDGGLIEIETSDRILVNERGDT